MQKWFYIIFSAILGLGAVYESRFLVFKSEASAGINSFIGGFNGNSALEERIRELEIENQDLKIQLFKEYLLAGESIKVYSIYPFNNIKEIAIAGGTANGLKDGDIVTFGKNILVGKIKKAFAEYSVVTTIFDPSWRMEARIGAAEADALFVGGNNPKMDLIAKSADIKTDDLILTAKQGFPYGLALGRIRTVDEEIGSPLKKASVEPLFQLSELRNVQIYR